MERKMYAVVHKDADGNWTIESEHTHVVDAATEAANWRGEFRRRYPGGYGHAWMVARRTPDGWAARDEAWHVSEDDGCTWMGPAILVDGRVRMG